MSITIWSLNTSDFYESLALKSSYLHSEEQQRAARFSTTELKRDWIITRAALREVLGDKFNQHPADLEFSYSARGKPYIVSSDGEFHGFNLSHTGDYAVIAVADTPDIGVDVEQLGQDDAILATTTVFLTDRERTILNRLQPANRRVEAYRYWVCKEAFVKAIGAGLSTDLTDVEVHFDEHSAPYFDLTRLGLTDNWQSQFINTPTGFVGAVVSNTSHRFSINYRSLHSISTALTDIPPGGQANL